MSGIPESPFIYPLTDRAMSGIEEISALVEALCRGGARFIQVREKGVSTREYTTIVKQAVAAARPFDAAIIVNDRADVAYYAGAAGVHLGDQEIPPTAARRLLGDQAIIGLSCHSIADVQAAQQQPIDYFAVGPVYGTTTKESRFDTVGLELVSSASAMGDLPLVAIGGISVETIPEVVAAGADGIAVISAVMRGDDVESLTREAIAAARKRP